MTNQTEFAFVSLTNQSTFLSSYQRQTLPKSHSESKQQQMLKQNEQNRFQNGQEEFHSLLASNGAFMDQELHQVMSNIQTETLSLRISTSRNSGGEEI